MTQNEIIEMAVQAGMNREVMMLGRNVELLEAFAKLVEKHEREACAKVCEEQYEYYGYDHVFAKAIRARENT